MTATGALPCPNCFLPMEKVEASHTYGQSIELDICISCHLVFFDKNEHRGLSAASTLALFERFKSNPVCKTGPESHLPICARCGNDQTLVHDSTIHGSFRSHRCGHCATITIKAVEYLRMTGVVSKVPDNEVHSTDLVAHPRNCESCGAPAVPTNQACTFCGLPPLRLDRVILHKLFDSLNKEHRRALMSDLTPQSFSASGGDSAGWHHNLRKLLHELTD